MTKNGLVEENVGPGLGSFVSYTQLDPEPDSSS